MLNENNLPIKSKLTSYNYSFKNENNLKEIYNKWDIFIDWSLNQGNSHFAFTINYPNDEIHEFQYCEKTFKDILKIHPISKDDHIFNLNYKRYSINEFYNFDHLECDFKSDDSWWYDIDAFLCLNGKNYCSIKLNSWIFTIVEENENGVVHLHGIIAIKNLMDFNKNIKNNIIKQFKKKYSFVDIVMKNLDTFIDVKGWVRYLHQNNQWVFKPLFSCLDKDVTFIQDLFLSSYISNYNMHNTCKESIQIWTNSGIFTELKIYNGPCFEIELEWRGSSGGIMVDYLCKDFIGIKLDKNEFNENLIVDLICNYMYLNKLYLNNNNVYKKIKNSEISYEKLGSINDLFFEDFQNTIIPFYTINFPIQFEGFDFYSLMKNFKLKMENNILKIKLISNNKINFNFNVMEFTDGVYDLKNNLFIKKNEVFLWKNEISTLKYYNQSYGRIRQDKPINWINGVKNALGNDKISFIVLCLFIANLFQPIDENTKKKFYIYTWPI